MMQFVIIGLSSLAVCLALVGMLILALRRGRLLFDQGRWHEALHGDRAKAEIARLTKDLMTWKAAAALNEQNAISWEMRAKAVLQASFGEDAERAKQRAQQAEDRAESLHDEIHVARVILGAHPAESLQHVAERSGPGNDHVLTEASLVPEEIHRLVIRRALPASSEAWATHCPRPDGWMDGVTCNA